MPVEKRPSPPPSRISHPLYYAASRDSVAPVGPTIAVGPGSHQRSFREAPIRHEDAMTLSPVVPASLAPAAATCSLDE